MDEAELFHSGNPWVISEFQLRLITLLRDDDARRSGISRTERQFEKSLAR